MSDAAETVVTPEEKPRAVRIIVAGTRGRLDTMSFSKTLLMLIKDIMREKCLTKADVEIISGMADSGADYYGVLFAERYKFDLKEFWAAWDDINAPGANVKENARQQKYNSRAGFDRNTQMAAYAKKATVASYLIAFWDGHSPGTSHMISTAKAHGVEVIELITKIMPKH